MNPYNDEQANSLPVQYDATVDDVEDKTFDAEGVAEEDKESEDFYTLKTKKPSLVWSLISILTSIAALVLSPLVYIAALPLAAVAIIFAIVSSRHLGFFNRMSLFGLIFGIFGAVFGVFHMVLDLTGVLALLGA